MRRSRRDPLHEPLPASDGLEPDFDNSLTVDGAASSHYALKVMSVVALIFVPLVLLYQGWTYYVFRRRLGLGEQPDPSDGSRRAATHDLTPPAAAE